MSRVERPRPETLLLAAAAAAAAASAFVSSRGVPPSQESDAQGTRETNAADTPAGNGSYVAGSYTPEEEFGDGLVTLLGTPPSTDYSSTPKLWRTRCWSRQQTTPSHIRN
ncbi:unnamed protein product [Pylaiella littoralis]